MLLFVCVTVVLAVVGSGTADLPSARREAQHHREAAGRHLLHKPLHAPTPQLRASLGWQEHSKNAIDGWEQLLRKGARNLKIDPNFMSASFCRSQKHFTNQSDTRGCFVLNHDRPIPLLDTRSDYNLLSQVLDYIADPAHARWFRQPGPAERRYFLLCFKSNPDPCGTSDQTQHWLSLVDDFFARATHLIQSLELNVEFAFDGGASGTPLCTCLKDRWRPWVGGLVSARGCDGAFVSNDRTLGYDRLQILNEPGKQWANATKRRFGKFVNSTYNYQLWEPKDQAEIDGYIAEYFDVGLPHTAGMRFAINIDSAMFQVFTGEQSAKSWHRVLVQNASNPHVVRVATDAVQPGETMMAVVYDGLGRLVYQVVKFDRLGGDMQPLFAHPVLFPAQARPNSLAVAMPSTEQQQLAPHQQLVLVSTADGNNVLARVSTTTFELTSVTRVNVSRPGDVFSVTTLVAACPGANDSGPCIVQVASTCANETLQSVSGAASCRTEVRVWMETGTGSTFALTQAVALAGTKVAGNASVAAAHLPAASGDGSSSRGGGHANTNANAKTNSHDSTGATCAGQLGIWLALDNDDASSSRPDAPVPPSNSSSRPEVQAAVVCWDGTSLTVAVPASSVGPGRNPSVGLLVPHGNGTEGDTAPVAALVVQDAFCQNNEKHNKQPKPSVCNQTATSTPGVLGYSYGHLDEWAKLLRGGAKPNACHPTIMHGAYDQGSAPRVELFPAATQSGGWGLVEVHEGVRSGATDVGACGLPQSYSQPSVVMDTWNVADLSQQQ